MLAVSERPASYSENALATLWSRAHTLANVLVTESGDCLRVIYPGRPSARAGPDFRDAVFQTEDGRTVSGDVEIHLTAPGWYSHGHHTDPNYNGVVLHVVLSTKQASDTRQQSGLRVPLVSVKAVASSLEDADLNAAPSLPLLDALRNSNDIASILDAAGDARFRAKGDGFALDISHVGPDQALYSGIMDALGYASNRKPFRALAQRVPYDMLSAIGKEPPATRLVAVTAMLIGASGLSHLVDESERPAELRRLRKNLPRVRPLAKKEWTLFRVRPGNHPVRRIIGAARVINGCLDLGLAETLRCDLIQGGTGALRRTVEQPPYIGRSRALDMIVNVILPFQYAHAGLRGKSELQTASLEAYAASPKLQENEVTREMRRLCETGKRVKLNARRQQGLIHLYKTAVWGKPVARNPQFGRAKVK